MNGPPNLASNGIKMLKGMPRSTVVLIVLCLLALAGFTMLFFSIPSLRAWSRIESAAICARKRDARTKMPWVFSSSRLNIAANGLLFTVTIKTLSLVSLLCNVDGALE